MATRTIKLSLGTHVALQDYKDGDTVQTNQTYTFIITVDSGYKLETAPYISFMGSSYTTEKQNFTFDTNNDQWTLTFTTKNIMSTNITFYSQNAVVDNTPKDIYIDINTDNLQNCVLDNTQYNTTLYKTNSYVITVNDGYTLNETPYLQFVLADGRTAQSQFSYNSDNNNYTLSVENYYSNITSVSVYAVAEKTTIINEKYPLLNVYKTSNSTLMALKDVRFFNVTTNQYEDLGSYILSFVRYPFNIDTNAQKNIILGFFTTSISSDTVNEQVYNFSLGSFLINGKYKNAVDINNCNIYIDLIYYGTYTLDSRYINTTIKIDYVTDIIANKTSICIYSNDNLIDVIKSQIGFNIPYILTTDRPHIYENFNNYETLASIEPKIRVIQNVNNSNLFKSNKYMTINELNGFNKFDIINLDLPNQITNKEYNEIISIISSGFYYTK